MKRLEKCGVIEFSRSPSAEVVDLFFVGKSNRQQRMVVDCRRSNCWFEPAAPVSLATGEVLARSELRRGAPLIVGQVDIREAFYRMELPGPLRATFGLRRIRAGDAGVASVGGALVGAGEFITPRLRALPMGWSWALWWCQAIHERCVEAAGLGPERRLCDGQEPAAITDRPHLQYVDNFAVLGEKREEVEADLTKVCDELRRRGLALHTEEVTVGETKLLGWVLSGEDCSLQPEGRRVWRLRFAIRWALRVGEISGRDLERLIGHAVFVALCRRESLAILGSVYAFVAAEPSERPRRLWCSVRRELDMLDALLPFLWQPLDAAWAEDVAMVDASP